MYINGGLILSCIMLKHWPCGGNITRSDKFSTKSKRSTTVEPIFYSRHIANVMLQAEFFGIVQ